MLAAADALRPTNESSPRASTSRATAPGVRGVIVVGADCRSLQAVRLQDLRHLQIPRQTDCDGLVWSQDGTLYASCVRGQTTVGNSEGRPAFHVAGCAPAWREDGALGVIRAGGLVVARAHGHPVEVLTRGELGDSLENVVARPATYGLAEIAWMDASHFAAIVRGARPWEEAVIVLSTAGNVELASTEYGARIADLRVSPRGDYIAYARTRLGREFVMLNVDGRSVSLPRIGNALSLAWSPDEARVAISTRTTTYVAEPGGSRPFLEVPRGGRYLAWVP